MFTALKSKVKKLKQEIVPVYYALLDKRTPLVAKLLAAFTVAYLLSPIDLIPDFIPVLGWLDDLLLVPLFIRATLCLIPKAIIVDIKTRINSGEKLPKKWYYAIPILMLYAYLLIVAWQHTKHWFGL